MGKKKAALAEAFVRDIVEHPGDDAPRLIYADWLDENGDPARAEFIRLQCRLAALAEGDPQRPALAQREEALRKEHGDDWKAEVPAVPGVRWEEFRRGFVGAAHIDLRKWTRDRDRRVAALFAAAPIQELELSDASPAPVASLLANPAVRGVREIHIFEATRAPAVAELLGACPYLTGLRKLDLYAVPIGDRGLAALAGSPHLAGLRELIVGECNLGLDGIRSLVASPYLRPAILVLEYAGIGDAGVAALAGWPGLANLEELHLRINAVGPAGVRALVTGDLGRLPALEFMHNPIGPEGVAALVAAPRLRPTILNLPGCRVGAEGARLLADSALLAGLRDLSLGRNDLGDAGAIALANSPGVAGLTWLWLDNNGITDAGALALARSPHLGTLRSFHMTDNPLGEAGLAALRARFPDRHF